MKPSYFITGGAGFIGSHFVDRLLADGAEVTIYDNFSSGKNWYFKHHAGNKALQVVTGEVGNLTELIFHMQGHETVIHLASNPDIARAATDPSVDFYQGTCLTQNVLEAMRLGGVKKLLYASGSGVYGDRGSKTINEYDGPRYPLSPYGASKLAGEAMISAYCAMFGMEAIAFRFANVVGPRQTHGVGYDFIRRLRENPKRLQVRGNGYQYKSYVHVTDVVGAVLLAASKTSIWPHRQAKKPFDVFNISLDDQLSVRNIADLVTAVMGVSSVIEYEPSDKGWAGDVPVVKLQSSKIRTLGWVPQISKSAEAMMDALLSMVKEEQG